VQPTRREFLKAATLGGVAASVLGFDLTPAYAAVRELKIARTTETRSTCPYCSVSCGVIIHTLGDRSRNVKPTVVHVEGDADHPINQGTLCPKGVTLKQNIVNDRRLTTVMYRAPRSTVWEEKSWDFMLDKLALNLKASRDNTFVAQDANGNIVNRTEGVAFAGGAAFSSEEGYFAAKMMRTLGIVHIEQQARV